MSSQQAESSVGPIRGNLNQKPRCRSDPLGRGILVHGRMAPERQRSCRLNVCKARKRNHSPSDMAARPPEL